MHYLCPKSLLLSIKEEKSRNDAQLIEVGSNVLDMDMNSDTSIDGEIEGEIDGEIEDFDSTLTENLNSTQINDAESTHGIAFIHTERVVRIENNDETNSTMKEVSFTENERKHDNHYLQSRKSIRVMWQEWTVELHKNKGALGITLEKAYPDLGIYSFFFFFFFFFVGLFCELCLCNTKNIFIFIITLRRKRKRLFKLL